MISQQDFNTRLSQILPPDTTGILLGVSGGMDSCALMELCYNQSIMMRVAHINYGLRGVDSDLDEALVRKICYEKKIPLEILKIKEKPKKNLQEWARKIRYDFFESLLQPSEVLLTGHHLDDRAEVFFLNILRGTGLAGLSLSNPRAFRPLSGYRRTEIELFVKEKKIPYREDISNQKIDYRRNFLRHRIFPELETRWPNYREAVTTCQTNIKAAHSYIQREVSRLKKEALLWQSDSFFLFDLKLIEKADPYLVEFFFHQYGWHDKEVEKILRKGMAGEFSSSTHRVRILRGQGLFFPKSMNWETFIKVKPDDMVHPDQPLSWKVWVKKQRLSLLEILNARYQNGVNDKNGISY